MKERIENIINEFLKLCEIPHPSHYEEAIGDYLCRWGESHALAVRRDDMGNVILDKPAAPGMEGAPITILQAHMDMVCVAEAGVSYDPKVDPIHVIRTESTLSADGTSLGADDGIGVAVALDILADSSLACGPIRAIFTVNEEDGMASMDMESEYLQGNYLINLDWEAQGSLCNSCAGGDFFRFVRAAEWQNVEDAYALRLKIDHLLGGHSGAEIHVGRTNAITALATALSLLRRKGFFFRVADFAGGQAPNAIPHSAEAVIVTDEEHFSTMKRELKTYAARWTESVGKAEPEAQFTVEKVASPGKVLSQSFSDDLLRLLTVAPNGIHTMSPYVSGLVESSSNIGLVKLSDTLEVSDFARSSSALAAEQLDLQCASVAAFCGFALYCDNRTPGWSVNPKSRLVPMACKAYRELTSEEMLVEPIHAGVECGAFALKNPKLDMISIGPTLRDVHTPQETCDIPSVGVTAELVRHILDTIAREGTHE